MMNARGPIDRHYKRTEDVSRPRAHSAKGDEDAVEDDLESDPTCSKLATQFVIDWMESMAVCQAYGARL